MSYANLLHVIAGAMVTGLIIFCLALALAVFFYVLHLLGRAALRIWCGWTTNHAEASCHDGVWQCKRCRFEWRAEP